MFVPSQIIGETCNGTRQIALTTLVIKLAKLVWEKSRVDRAWALLIDSAAFGLVGGGRGRTLLLWQSVCLVLCHSVRGPRDPCSHLQLTLPVFGSRIMKIIPTVPLARASLLRACRRLALSSLHQLQFQVQWSIHGITALDWCGESDL